MNIVPEISKLRGRAAEVSALLKMLSHPNRLLIVCELMEGERSVSEIEQNTGVRQPGLSRELARLRAQDLVTTNRESKAVFYRLSDQRLEDLVSALCAAFADGSPPSENYETEETGKAKPGEKGVEFAQVGNRAAGRVRIKPDPYRKQ